MVIDSDRRPGLPLGMRKRLGSLAIFVAALLLITSSGNAAVKQGDMCKKVGSTSTVNGVKFTCVKSGKKLIWGKGVSVKKPASNPVAMASPSPSPSPTTSKAPTPAPTQTPTPTAEPIVLPTSFSDLFENRKGISLAAWQKSSEIIKSSKNKSGTLEIFTGPNTKPFFDDYPTPVSLVSRLFPTRGEPARTIVIRYKYVDIEWAEALLRSKLTEQEFTRLNNNEGGRAILGRCDANSRNCVGAMQQTTGAGLSLIIQGVPNMINQGDPTGTLRLGTGMLEAHEYFHALQRIPIMDKTDVWPHAWFREGGAEWVQNMSVNFADFKNYEEFLRLDCKFDCRVLSEADIVAFLEGSKENYTPPKFQQFLNYSLGSHVIEALVAVKGPDTLIDMYEQMGKRLTFDQAFKNTYGVEWSYAIPILAKSIHANFKG